MNSAPNETKVNIRDCLNAFHSQNFKKCIALSEHLLSKPEYKSNEMLGYLKVISQIRSSHVDDLLDIEDVHLPEEKENIKMSIDF